MIRIKETIRCSFIRLPLPVGCHERKLDDVAPISRISLPLALSSLNLTIELEGMRAHGRINKERDRKDARNSINNDTESTIEVERERR